MLLEPLAVTLQVTNFFEQLNISYLLGGSFASIIYGIVRTTQDSDILTEMGKEHISTFIQQLSKESQAFVKVCTAEDIILAKLEWYRLGVKFPSVSGAMSWAL